MKFGVATIVLNDPKGMERLLDSTLDFDVVYVYDGRFLGFNGPKLSNDGTRELVQSYHNTKLFDAPDLMENQKRDLYMRQAEKDNVDFLLHVDSDEYVESDYGKFTKYCEDVLSKTGFHCFNVTMNYFDLQWQQQWPYRLFYKPEKITYPKYHNEIWANGMMINSQHRTVLVEDLVLYHDKSFRTKEREATNKKWYDKYPLH